MTLSQGSQQAGAVYLACGADIYPDSAGAGELAVTRCSDGSTVRYGIPCPTPDICPKDGGVPGGLLDNCEGYCRCAKCSVTGATSGCVNRCKPLLPTRVNPVVTLDSFLSTLASDRSDQGGVFGNTRQSDPLFRPPGDTPGDITSPSNTMSLISLSWPSPEGDRRLSVWPRFGKRPR